jgi:hypothetical protein
MLLVLFFQKLTMCFSTLAAYDSKVPAIFYHLSKASPALVKIAERAQHNIWLHVVNPMEHAFTPARLNRETYSQEEVDCASLLQLVSVEFEDECVKKCHVQQCRQKKVVITWRSSYP